MGAAISEQNSMNFIMSFQRKKWKTKDVLNLPKFFLYIQGWRSHLIILKLMDPWIIVLC